MSKFTVQKERSKKYLINSEYRMKPKNLVKIIEVANCYNTI